MHSNFKQRAEELSISQHADDTLRSFCRWQKFVNPKDDTHPNHHDVAVLLTRYESGKRQYSLKCIFFK